MNYVKTIISIIVLAAFLSPIASSVVDAQQAGLLGAFEPRKYGSTLELHISDEGKVVIHGARVDQIAGNTFYTKLYWGQAFLRLLVRTDGNTKITKKFGEPINYAQISVGDYLTIEGEFYSGSSTLDVLAKNIKNWSQQTQEDQYSGTITARGSAENTFTFVTSQRGTITLAFSTTTTAYITKGNLVINPAQLKVGDRVLSASGTYDHMSKTLNARSAKIHQDMSVFKPQNYEGTIKSVDGMTLPTTMIVRVGSKDYTVVLSGGTEVLNKNRGRVSLQRFIAGDRVRFYGTLRESDQGMIDAELVRNISL